MPDKKKKSKSAKKSKSTKKTKSAGKNKTKKVTTHSKAKKSATKGGNKSSVKKKSAAAKLKPAASLSIEQVAHRAYEIWLDSGCAPGRDEDNWHLAERQLRAEHGID